MSAETQKAPFFAFCTQTYIFTYIALSTGLERARTSFEIGLTNT